MKSKVSSWLSSVCNLTAIARTQPHAAYSALTHASGPICAAQSVTSWSHSMTSCEPNSSQHSQGSLHLECALFALPARMGGLGIAIPFQQADREHLSSLMVTSARTTLYCRTRPMDTRSLPSNWNLRLSLETKTGRNAQKLHVNSL